MRPLTGQPERLTGWELVESAPASAWRPTAEQEHAIARRSEPLLLAAGAGSGKTAVLVERYVRAVCEDGIDPERILAITFTERAAAELRARVSARLHASGLTQAAARVSQHAYVGTFHGFCARLLRSYTSEAKLGAGEWEILDEGLAGRLRRRAFAQALGELMEGERAEAVDLIAAYGADRARATILGMHAQLRSRGQRAPRLPAPDVPELGDYGPSASGGQGELSSAAELEARRALDVRAARGVRVWDELLARYGERYELAKRARSGLDFDDLELRALELLTHNLDVRRACSERLELVMVDELQDVNPRQLALVRALERDNLFTVGDAWQSIYGFRHADVSLFRARETQLAPLGQSLSLTSNFRGHAHLLQAVNAVFATRFGAAFTPLHAGREHDRRREAREEPLLELLLTHRRGWPAGADGRDVGHAADTAGSGCVAAGGVSANRAAGTAVGGAGAGGVRGVGVGGAGAGGAGDVGGAGDTGVAPWREAEARALAERVAELVRSGRARPGGVAVLLRATGELECYERALRRQGLRTLATGGAFWMRQEVVDLLAHLRVLADPADEVALYGVLSAPPLGLSPDELARLATAARAQGRSVWEVARDPCFSAEAVESAELPELCDWLERERALAERLPLPELLERAIAHGAHLGRLAQMEDGERRIANVRKLVDLAGQWERTEGHDLRGFLDEAAFQAGAGGPGGRLAGADTPGEPDAPVRGIPPGEAGESGGPGDRDRDREPDPDAVRLMSVHAAKGLEFDVVCLADLGRAPSASTPDLLVDGERIGVRLIELDDPEPRPALQFSELALERRDAQAEEEDRIAYVAMTRARERLLLSGAVDFANWPRERPGGPPIAWLGPALAPELPGLCAAAVRGRIASPPSSLTVDGTDVPLSLRLNMARGQDAPTG